MSLLVLYGAPGTIRTCDRLVRSQVLYPTELRALLELRTIHGYQDEFHIFMRKIDSSLYR